MAEAWEQIENEPDEAFARFLLYRGLGPGRSLQATYIYYLATFRNATSEATPRQKKPQVPGHWSDDSAKWKWVDRAAAYDVQVLRTHGEKIAVLWIGILTTAAQKCAEKLAQPTCKPKDFMQCLAIIDRLAVFLNPDAVKSLQPAASSTRPKQPELAAVR